MTDDGSKMKLIIDISEELYAKVPTLVNKGSIWIGDVLEAVKNGTPLEAQSTDAVKSDCTTEEIAKSFTEDVEAVKDQLDGQSTNIIVEMHPKEAIEILKYERDNDIFVSTEHRARIHQALTMAIQALEAHPTNAVILNVTSEGCWREEEEYSCGLKSKKIWWDDSVAESEDEE